MAAERSFSEGVIAFLADGRDTKASKGSLPKALTDSQSLPMAPKGFYRLAKAPKDSQGLPKASEGLS